MSILHLDGIGRAVVATGQGSSVRLLQGWKASARSRGTFLQRLSFYLDRWPVRAKGGSLEAHVAAVSMDM